MSVDRILDMNAVQVFLTVAEEGSMSGAARRLGVTQSAISQSVRQLEQLLGVRLVDRARRPMQLTPFGVALRHRGTRVLMEVANLKGQVLEAGSGVKPTLRLGLVDSFASLCGAALTKDLFERTAQLSVRSGLSPQLGAALHKRELDMIVASEPLEAYAGLERFRLFTEQYLIIMPPGERHGTITLDGLKQLGKRLPLVRYNGKSQVGIHIGTFLRRHGITASNHLELDNAATVAGMVAAGIGWAMTTPMCLMQNEKAATRVTTLRLERSAPERALFVIARQGEYDQFFKHVCGIASNIVQTEYLAGLRQIIPQLDMLVTPAEEEDVA